MAPNDASETGTAIGCSRKISSYENIDYVARFLLKSNLSMGAERDNTCGANTVSTGKCAGRVGAVPNLTGVEALGAALYSAGFGWMGWLLWKELVQARGWHLACYPTCMKKTTIYLDEVVLERLRRLSRTEG